MRRTRTRARVLLAVAVVACSAEKQVPRDASVDAFQFKDGAADAPDDASLTCEPTGNCPLGPACGITCCGEGERCVGGACTCGTTGACTTVGETCRGGPIGPLSCGTFCCNKGGANPCAI